MAAKSQRERRVLVLGRCWGEGPSCVGAMEQLGAPLLASECSGGSSAERAVLLCLLCEACVTSGQVPGYHCRTTSRCVEETRNRISRRPLVGCRRCPAPCGTAFASGRPWGFLLVPCAAGWSEFEPAEFEN